MESKTKRISRASLVYHSGLLESRVNSAIDDTAKQLLAPPDELGDTRRHLLQERLANLDRARDLINRARVAIWNLT